MAQRLSRRAFLKSAGLVAAGLFSTGCKAAQKKLPNVVLIYADDLGYGDVSCYGAKVQTPNIDRIAREGIRFTNAHSASATCTPSRYALMTGEYAWRQKGTGILPGDARLIVGPGRMTLPSLMQKAGYRTGAVGKWHLGLGAGDVDWNAEIKPGPLEIGFGYCFLIPATGDRVPCVYVEDRRGVGLDPKDPIQVSYKQPVGNEPTGKEHPELLKVHPSHGHDQTIVNGISRIGYMTGGKAARWVDEDMADTITGKVRHIALAWNSYLDAYEEHFFYRTNCQYDFGGWQGDPTEAVNRPLNKFLGLPPTLTTERQARVFRCPADEGSVNDPVSTYLRYGNSYQANPLLLYPGQVAAARNWAAEPWRTVFSLLPGKITRDHAAEPSRLLLVGDCHWTDQYDPLWMICGKSWHGDRHHYNLAFLDGHVAYLRVRKGLYVAPDYRVQPFKEIDPAVMDLQEQVPCACGKE